MAVDVASDALVVRDSAKRLNSVRLLHGVAISAACRMDGASDKRIPRVLSPLYVGGSAFVVLHGTLRIVVVD